MAHPTRNIYQTLIDFDEEEDTNSEFVQAQTTISPKKIKVPDAVPLRKTTSPKKNKVSETVPAQKTSSPRKIKVPFEISNAWEWNGKKPADNELPSDESDEDESPFEDKDDDWADDAQSSAGTLAHSDAVNHASPRRQLQTRTNGVHDNGAAKPYSYPPPKNVRGPHQRSSPRPPQMHPLPKRPHPVFIFRRENEARAAFRRRLPPNGKFTLHKAWYEIEPDWKRMHAMLEEIGVRLNSYVRPPLNPNDRELPIWGKPNRVNATTAALNEWLRRSEEDQGSHTSSFKRHNFAHITSSIGSKYKLEQKRILKEAAIQGYQQVPEAGRHFDFTGAYLWPVEEVRPQDIFGPSMEAFDPMRFQYQCHIVFDDKQTVFRVFASRIESVQKSMARIEGSLRSYVARNSRPIVEILMEPPESSIIRKDVRLLDGSPDADSKRGKITILTGAILDAEHQAKWHQKREEMKALNLVHTEEALKSMTLKLPHYQGKIRMRILFGTFELRMFKWKGGKESVPFEEFMTNVKEPGTKGNLIRDMQIKKDASTIMSFIYKATDMIVPADNSTFTLEEVAPTISARFVVHRFKKPSVKLEVETNLSSMDGWYDKGGSVWTRYDGKDTTTPLEILNARIDGGVSWKFQVATEHDLDASRIDPKMTAFAQSVELKKISMKNIELTGRRLFDWDTSFGSLKPSQFEQKIGFRYRIVGASDWILEIARYDSYTQNPNDPATTNWGASMWNSEWDYLLTENAGLGIGLSASWAPKLETFFPNESGLQNSGARNGLAKFVKIMQGVTDFLSEIKKVPPHMRG